MSRDSAALPRSRWARIAARLDAYERLIRLDRPIGTLLLLWPTLTALWIATSGSPSVVVVVIFVLGTLLMRSAGCAMNDYADRNFDAFVERTRNRPLARREIEPWEALALAAVLALAAFLLIVRFNRFTALLSIPALAIAIAYPFFKRFFVLPQAFLGIAFSFGIPMAFAAVYGGVPAGGWWLFAANFFWVFAYDTEYAMVDRDDDLKLGLRTSAIALGRFDVPAVMACYAIYLGMLLLVGRMQSLGPFFYAGVLVATLLALWHYVLIRKRERAGCFRAFLGNHWLGLAIFAGTVADYAMRAPQWPPRWLAL
ncbi:MAG TPA: 4-hydroxybenzoate octaprenyltransferase [Casimicrobiaceae bacterium]|nr:4-hydroxybenzoate octaprenyltransferase [Casimicrobiaceae bacterium]